MAWLPGSEKKVWQMNIFPAKLSDNFSFKLGVDLGKIWPLIWAKGEVRSLPEITVVFFSIEFLSYNLGKFSAIIATTSPKSYLAFILIRPVFAFFFKRKTTRFRLGRVQIRLV